MINHKVKTISIIFIAYLISYHDNPQYSPTVHVLDLASALNVGHHQATEQEQRNVFFFRFLFYKNMVVIYVFLLGEAVYS